MPAAFPHPADVEKAMFVMCRSLRENDRRRYAAVERGERSLFNDQFLAAFGLDRLPLTDTSLADALGLASGLAADLLDAITVESVVSFDTMQAWLDGGVE